MDRAESSVSDVVVGGPRGDHGGVEWPPLGELLPELGATRQSTVNALRAGRRLNMILDLIVMLACDCLDLNTQSLYDPGLKLIVAAMNFAQTAATASAQTVAQIERVSESPTGRTPVYPGVERWAMIRSVQTCSFVQTGLRIRSTFPNLSPRAMSVLKAGQSQSLRSGKKIFEGMMRALDRGRDMHMVHLLRTRQIAAGVEPTVERVAADEMDGFTATWLGLEHHKAYGAGGWGGGGGGGDGEGEGGARDAGDAGEEKEAGKGGEVGVGAGKAAPTESETIVGAIVDGIVEQVTAFRRVMDGTQALLECFSQQRASSAVGGEGGGGPGEGGTGGAGGGGAVDDFCVQMFPTVARLVYDGAEQNICLLLLMLCRDATGSGKDLVDASEQKASGQAAKERDATAAQQTIAEVRGRKG
jgi:hypothetical protein